MNTASDRKSWSWLRRATTRDRSGSAPRAAPSAVPPQLGTRFRLRETLGSGGMGTVYLAYDRQQGEEVALKLLHSLAPEDRLDLKTEFRALAHIVHPNLVNLYELVADADTCFFTMELVRGKNFISHVRSLPSPMDRYHRLRDAARQLALALNALHDGGKLHRDIKPHNVLVTDAGRVVLLDFGLVAKLSQITRDADRGGFAGTALYMAPEQVSGEGLSSAADWYSYGVTLYEAITDQLPIDGEPIEVAIKKRDFVPHSLRIQGFDVPETLDDLVMRLLDPNPARRPSGEEVIAHFGGEPAKLSLVHGDDTESSVQPLLIGRDAEMAALGEDLERARDGATRIVHVSGASGIGKSSLIRAFLGAPSTQEFAVVLTARCHPQEAIAFNAIDGLVDELARVMKRRAQDTLPKLDPREAFALMKVFPTLRPVLSTGDTSVRGLALDVHQIRKHASAGLRKLLGRVASDRVVVLWVDDAQWADHDSGMVLRDLLRGSEQLRLLLLLSYRAEDMATSACLRVLEDDDTTTQRKTHVKLGPLDARDSRRVVESHLDHAPGEVGDALASLLVMCEGSPFFLCELARYLNASGSDAGPPERMSLEHMLRARTRELPVQAHSVLRVFSVAGSPLEQRVALRAAGLTEHERGLITNLERLSILRTTDPGQRISEVYHHRIRDEVLKQLSTSERTECHKAIGNALLASTTGSALAAVDHFEAAQDSEALRRYIVPAANQASSVMAFDRAARLYERAIELGDVEVEPHELYRKLALALSHTGRGKEAGEAFMKAADALKQRADAEPEQIVHLQQKAAEQFIQTGHYQQGLDTLYHVFAELGVPFPKTRDEAMRKANGLRLLSLVKRVSLPKIDATREPSAIELRRFDALWSANIRIAMIDQAISSYATARCAADSVKLGEPSRMIRALALEGANWATLPIKRFQKRADQMLGVAKQLSERGATPYDEAFIIAAGAVAACFRCEFRRVVQDMDQAISMIRVAAPGMQWEAGLWQMWSMIGLTHLGEMRELIKRAESVREDAETRNDRFMAQNISLGRPTTAWLAQDRAKYALDQADRALEWAPTDYTTQHYQHYISTVEAWLYLREPATAWKRTVFTWPSHKKNVYMMIVFCRDELLQARARAAIALAAAGQSAAQREGTTVEELRRTAEQAANAMFKHDLPMSRPWALLVRAALQHQRGQDGEARELLAAAIDEFDACEMSLYREAARYRLGSLLGGEQGAEAVRAATRWMNDQRIVKPEAMARVLAPGFEA